MAENRTEIKQREYLIGDMSEIVGVSRDTLRFYEKKGIIKARKKENGYRIFHKRRADAGAGHQAVSVSGSRSLYQQ